MFELRGAGMRGEGRERVLGAGEEEGGTGGQVGGEREGACW